ncbi:MAG: choice-of-anchor D domain-containing protein [Leptothrix ochracea]
MRFSSRAFSRTATAGAVTALTLMTLAGGAAAQVPNSVAGKNLWTASCGAAGGCHSDPVAGAINYTDPQFAQFGASADNTKNAVFGIGLSSSGIAGRVKGKNQMLGFKATLTDLDYNNLAAYLAQVSGRTLACTSAGTPTAAAPATAVACPVPPPTATVTASLAFNTVAGTPAATQTATLTSTGTSPLNITSVALAAGSDPAFSVVNNCPAQLTAAGGATTTCTVTVSYAPMAAATAATATLNIVTDAGTKTVSLSGSATAAPAPAMSLSSSAAQSLSANTGTSANGTAITLTNSGTAPLNNLVISTAAPFAHTTTCGTTLAAGANCTITPQFTPTVTGAVSGSLSISGTGVTTQTVTLNGTGTAPGVSLNATTLNMTAMIGGTSAPSTVTLTNSGTGPLTVALPTASPTASFAVTSSDCATKSPIAAGGTCAITTTFTGGSAAGATPGTVTITSDAVSTPNTISLVGTTLAAGSPTLSWDAALSTSTYAFNTAAAPTTVGTGVSKTFTLSSNTGSTAAVTVVPSVNNTDFTLGGTCVTPGTVAANGGSCQLTVTFTPTSAGSKTATLSLTGSGAMLPAVVSLSGVAVAAATPAPTSSSGGGCTLGAADQPMDPLWMLMLGGAALVWRRRASRQAV